MDWLSPLLKLLPIVISLRRRFTIWWRHQSPVATQMIRYDGILWSALHIPHTTNTWTAGGPFCPEDQTLLQAVAMMTGWRRKPEDSDVLGVTISHLYCPSCSAQFRLGAPEAGYMRTIADSRRGVLDMILKSKGPAALGMMPSQLERDIHLGLLPPDWLQ